MQQSMCLLHVQGQLLDKHHIKQGLAEAAYIMFVRNYQLTLLLVLVMLMHLYMFRATRLTKKTPSLKASPIISATQNISRESYMLHKELSGHDLREETPSLKKSPITSATQNISKYSNMLHRELSGHKLRAREHHFSMWEKRRAL